MSHQDNNNIRGDLQPTNLNWQRFNAPGFHSTINTEQASQYGSNYQNQHSFQSIPPFNLSSLPPASSSPAGGFRNLENENNTSNTQAPGSFHSESDTPAQYFNDNQHNQPFQSYGIQPSIPFHNYSNPHPLPSFNYGNQPQYYGSQVQPTRSYDNQTPQPPHTYGNRPPNITGNQTSQPFQNHNNRPPHPYGDQTPQSYCLQSSGFDGPPLQRGCFQPQTFSHSQFVQPPRQPTVIETLFRFPPPMTIPPGQGINFTSSNVFSENKTEIYTDDDKKWMKDWMKNVQRRNDNEKINNGISDLKINEIQKKLLRYAILVNELDKIIEVLSHSSEDQIEWESTVKKSENLKKELEELRTFFNEKQTQNRIQEILTKRRGKRIKWRKGRAKRAEKRKRISEDRQIKEKKMDDKFKMLNNEEKEKLQEEKMKREADSVLREIRMKQEDVVKMQKLLEALTKLRDIRKKKGEMHGYIEDSRANAFFDKMKSEFGSLLSDQQNLYLAEEQTLKIMLEESRTTSFHPKIVPEKRPLSLHQLKKSIWEIYFGKDEPKNEYEKSFLAAEESVEILVKRRKDWDEYLVPEDNPLGSSMPLGWVVPNSEPNEDWKGFQKRF